MRTVCVNQKDISLGRREDPSYCPVARALKRELGKPVSVAGARGFRFCGASANMDLRYVKLPEEVVRFIIYFDRGLPVEPFCFEVEL